MTKLVPPSRIGTPSPTRSWRRRRSMPSQSTGLRQWYHGAPLGAAGFDRSRSPGVALAVGVLARRWMYPLLAVCMGGMALGIGLTLVAAAQANMTYEASSALLVTAAVYAVAFAQGRLMRQRGVSRLHFWAMAAIFVAVRWLLVFPLFAALRGGVFESQIAVVARDPLVLIQVSLAVALMATTGEAIVAFVARRARTDLNGPQSAGEAEAAPETGTIR